MYKLSVVGLVSVLAAGCAVNHTSSTVNNGGTIPYTTPYNLDNKGQDHFPVTRTATGEKVFIFDPKVTAWAVYDEQGNRIKTGSGSGGKDYCADVGRSCRTVTGVFKVYNKKDENCKSSRYPVETNGGAKMPYCMHFHGGFAIHAAYEVPNYNASHGCVRVLPSAAKWLNERVMDVGTTVIIKPYN